MVKHGQTPCRNNNNNNNNNLSGQFYAATASGLSTILLLTLLKMCPRLFH